MSRRWDVCIQKYFFWQSTLELMSTLLRFNMTYGDIVTIYTINEQIILNINNVINEYNIVTINEI